MAWLPAKRKPRLALLQRWRVVLGVVLVTLPLITLAAFHALKFPPTIPGPSFRNLVLAHRGVSTRAPENTLAAFRLAIEQGTGIEVDVALTKDHHIVVIHDETVDRTTDGHGRVSELTLAEIKALRIRGPHTEAYPDEHVPEFEEVAALAVEARVHMDIDCGVFLDDREAFARALHEVYARHPRLYDLAFASSLQPLILRAIREVDPRILTGFTFLPNETGEFFQDALAESEWLPRFLGVGFLVVHKSLVEPSMVEKWARRGVLVIAFTVNTAEDKKALEGYADLGIGYESDCGTGTCPDRLYKNLKGSPIEGSPTPR